MDSAGTREPSLPCCVVSPTHKICRTDILVQSSVYIKPDLLSCPHSTPHLVIHPSIGTGEVHLKGSEYLSRGHTGFSSGGHGSSLVT